MLIADQLSRSLNLENATETSLYEGKVINTIDIESVNMTENIPISSHRLQEIKQFTS